MNNDHAALNNAREDALREEHYKDRDGNPVTLEKLCQLEPAWAANRMRVGARILESRDAHAQRAKQAEDECAALRARLAVLEDAVQKVRARCSVELVGGSTRDGGIRAQAISHERDAFLALLPPVPAPAPAPPAEGTP